jgi:hypothetical protein
LIACGRITEAAALIDPRTAGPVDRDNWPLHGCRAEIDLLRGEVDAAAQRLNQLEIGPGLEHACLFGLRVAEVALWTGRPHEALEEIWRVLERLEGADLVIWSGELLPVGMRACADLAEESRARHENDALRAALTAADDLASWVKRERDVPFTEHPFLAIIPATRATWDAERSRVDGASDPVAWVSPRSGGRRWTAGTAPDTPAGGRPKPCWPRRTVAGPQRACYPRLRVWGWSMCR